MKRPQEYLLRNNTPIAYLLTWAGILFFLCLMPIIDQYLVDYTHHGSPLRQILPGGLGLISGSSVVAGTLILFISSLHIRLSKYRLLSVLLSLVIFVLQLAGQLLVYFLILYFFVGIEL